MDTHRTFVAIELPPFVRAKVIEHIDQLRRNMPDARASWSREHNLHLTLKFFGNVPVAEIPKLSDAIAHAVSGVKPFELTVEGCGVFPPRGKPNVMWIAVEERSAGILPAGHARLAGTRLSEDKNSGHATALPTALTFLHQRIEDECARAGFAREPRAFHPHLTIARLRKTDGERRLAEAHQKLGFAPETFAVSELVLFKSDLLAEGSKHTPISRHALKELVSI